MNHNDMLRALSEAFNEEIRKLGEDMARGTAKDYGEYKFACGIVRGLMTANSLLRETADKMERDEDD